MATAFQSSVDTRKTFSTMMLETFVFAAAGLALGVLIDKQFDKLRKQFPDAKLWLIGGQILLLALVVVSAFKFLPRGDLVEHFQVTLPGMAFPAMYFGVQSSLFTAAQSV